MIYSSFLELRLWQRVSGDSESSPESSKSEAVESSDDSKRPLKKGNMFLIFS